jgi:hypothetical protein
MGIENSKTSTAAWRRWVKAGVDLASKISGTPANNQVAVWTGATDIEGDSNLTWDGSTLAATGNATVSNGVNRLTRSGGYVDVASASAPSSGQILTATGASAATWQAPAVGTWALINTTAVSGSTTISFTIPSGATQIRVVFDEVSSANTGDFFIQLGDSGGIETTGYTSSTTFITATSTGASGYTTGFALRNGAASIAASGIWDFSLAWPEFNGWSSSAVMRLHATATAHSAGYKACSGEVTTLRLSTYDGAAYDAGVVSVYYMK